MEWLEFVVGPFLQWLWQTTLIASLMICLILAVQKLLGRRLGPRWSHALWLVLLIRMVAPWAPPSRISLLSLLPFSVRHAQPAATAARAEAEPDLLARIASGGAEATGPQDAASGLAIQKAASARPQESAGAGQRVEPARLSLHRVVPVLWLAGAALVGAYVSAAHFALWRIVRRDRPLVDQPMLELFEECKTQMGVQTIVAVVPSDQVAVPALFGFVRPRLLFPRHMLDAAGRDEMRYVFLHELAHLKRHDIYLGWLASLLQALHWFNPLIWLAFHRMRIDRELACDALVLACTGEQESREYGKAIVALLQRLSRSRPLPAMAGVLEDKSQLKRRIAMITQFKSASYRWSPLALALVVALGCASLPNAKHGESPQPAVIAASGEPHAAPVAAEPNVFIDPNSGIRFTKVKTFSGPSDIIEYSTRLSLSPNGKFLLNGVRVIPLDDSAPFDLLDMPGGRAVSWSPDGRKLAFYTSEGMWLMEVDPDSGRPVGSPKKFVDESNPMRGLRWSPDSQKIIFGRRPTEPGDSGLGTAWTVAIGGGEPTLLTDRFSFGLVSPDGKMVAASDSQGGVLNPTPDPLWVKPVAGGEPRKVNDDIRTKCVVWSADSEWLVVSNHNDDQGIRFVRIADGHEVWVNTPGPSGSGLIDRSPQGRKLLFYQTPYDMKEVLRVVSVAGGPPAEMGWPDLSFDQWWSGHQLWAQDSRSILVEGTGGRDQWGFWDVPLDGRSPRLLTIDTPMCRDAYMRLFSPDGGKLLLFMGGVTGNWDLWTVPVSLAQMKSSGPPVKAFGGDAPLCAEWGNSWILGPRTAARSPSSTTGISGWRARMARAFCN